MISDTWSIPAVLTLLVASLALFGSRPVHDRIAPEVARKLLNISMGMLALSFPWVFSHPGQVWLLASLATLGLLALRYVSRLKTQLGGAIHTIRRESYGELCFPVAVATLYTLADGQLSLYLIPLLVLTFADSLAALIGIFHGTHRYQSPDGCKTLEGSLTMFIISMLCTYGVLSIESSMSPLSILLVAFNLSVVITLVEAIAWRGLDNFMIPVAGFYLLQAYLPLGNADLAAHAFMYGSFVALLLAAQKSWPLGN